MVEIKSALGRK